MKRFVVISAASMAFALSLGAPLLSAALPAEAATLLRNISVTVTTDMCPRGGKVESANVTIDTPGTAATSSGDTASGLEAFYGTDMVHGTNFCQTGSYFGFRVGYYNDNWTIARFFSNSGQHMYV
jgi:hypothetical protein